MFFIYFEISSTIWFLESPIETWVLLGQMVTLCFETNLMFFFGEVCCIYWIKFTRSCLLNREIKLKSKKMNQSYGLGDFCDGPSPCQTLNCMNGGRCEVDSISKEPSCLCQDGWHGTKCELVDPCHASRNPCQNGAVCEASVDSQEAVCRCQVEYYGAFCQHL